MIEKINKEIDVIKDFVKLLIENKDLSPNFICELLQVADRNLSQLQYMLELIVGEETSTLTLKLNLDEAVFIRSKTDKDWISVKNISLLETGQIFTTENGQKKGEEYKLISWQLGSAYYTVDVEIIKGQNAIVTN